MKKLICYGIFILFLISSAVALSCNYNPTPQYGAGKPILWQCSHDASTTCFSYVKFGDDLIQASPYPTMNADEDDVREGFNCPGICTIQFETKDLRTDRNVTFGVRCENETVENTITPDLTGEFMDERVMDKANYIRENIWYIVMLVVIIIFAGITIITIWKIIKTR